MTQNQNRTDTAPKYRTMMKGESLTPQTVEYLTPDKFKKLEVRTPLTVACTPPSTNLVSSKLNGDRPSFSHCSNDDQPIRMVGQQGSFDSDFSDGTPRSHSKRRQEIPMSLVAPHSPECHQRMNTRNNSLDFSQPLNSTSSIGSFINEIPSNTTRQRQSYLRRIEYPVNGNSLPKRDLSPLNKNLDTTKLNHAANNHILQTSSSESLSPGRIPYSPSKSKSTSYFKKGTILSNFSIFSSKQSQASLELPFGNNRKYKKIIFGKSSLSGKRLGKLKLLPACLVLMCITMGCIFATKYKSEQSKIMRIKKSYTTDIKPHVYGTLTGSEDPTKKKKTKSKALQRLSSVSKVKPRKKTDEYRMPHSTASVILQSKTKPTNTTPFNSLFDRATSNNEKLKAEDSFIFGTDDTRKPVKHESYPRIIYSDQQSSRHHKLPPTRVITQYPSEFSDNTQFYSLYSSDDEKLREMETREPFENAECVPMQKWQTTFNPSCNGMHELDLVRMEDPDSNGSITLFGKKGYWRNAWSVDILGENRKRDDREKVVLKTLKYNHNFEDAHFEHDRIDAIAMERLTSSPHVINIYGFCGQSVITEHADRTPLGSLADKSKKKPLKRLEIARDIASGLADVHGMDGDGNATFVHLDINPANVIVIGKTLKLNDFNIGILRRWNTTSNTPCGFPAQYPNPQWRSPEEANESQHLTEKVDVFSMGHIFFRLICGHEPWNKLELNGKPNKTEMTKKVKSGVLPRIPDEIMNTKDPEVRAILDAMLSCYRFDPTERPNAREIANELGVIHSKLKTELNISKKSRESSKIKKKGVSKEKRDDLPDKRKDGSNLKTKNGLKGFQLTKNRKTLS